MTLHASYGSPPDGFSCLAASQASGFIRRTVDAIAIVANFAGSWQWNVYDTTGDTGQSLAGRRAWIMDAATAAKEARAALDKIKATHDCAAPPDLEF